MKLLVAIITVIFSLQAVLMSGVMAEGHLADAEDSASSPFNQDITEAKAKGSFAAETRLHPQDSGSNTPQDTLCCTIECSCTSFLAQPTPLISAQPSGIENPFYLVHLTDPPSFVLPDPPRTTQI